MNKLATELREEAETSPASSFLIAAADEIERMQKDRDHYWDQAESLFKRFGRHLRRDKSLKPKAYFARPITQFGTTKDESDMAEIDAAGFTVLEITDDKTQRRYKLHGMKAFYSRIEICDVLFFTAFPDGKIGAGVAKEIDHANTCGLPVFELPTQLYERQLSVEETRERVHK